MSIEQMAHYQSKLAFEMDSWDLHVALSNGEPFVVVDGRSEAAFAKEHIPGAINLPLDRLACEQVPKAAEVHVICQGGVRSLKACEQLAAWQGDYVAR